MEHLVASTKTGGENAVVYHNVPQEAAQVPGQNWGWWVSLPLSILSNLS